MIDEKDKYPEGHFVGMWMGICMAIFSGIGIPLFIIMDNPGFIAIGPGIGVGVGLSIGSSIEQRYKKEGRIRPKNEKEQKAVKLLAAIGIATLLIGIATFLVWFMR